MGMETTACCICQKSKAPITCGICESSVCKSCTEFLDADSFSFLPQVPAELSHLAYCRLCFDAQVAPALENYQENVTKAADIQVYLKNQSKETRLFKRTEDRFSVVNCDDHDETLLRLAFQAVQAGYNALIDVEIDGKKVRQGSYQTSTYQGTGIGAHLTGKRKP